MMKYLMSAAVLALTASAASATTVNFATYKGGWNSGAYTYGAMDEVSVNGANVDTDGKITTLSPKIKSWSGGAGGLGICDKAYCTGGTGENGYYDQHTIDGKNSANMAILNFGALDVEITSVTFAYWDSSDDFDFASYATGLVGDSALTWTEDKVIGGSGSVRTYSFASGALSGSIFGFGADYHDDEFKLQSLTYEVNDGGPVVPLPAAGWMLMAALGGLTAAKRRKG